ncbi:glycosyltransferase family 2 protein [Kocuria rosea]|uniref:Glycosyltransferase family 2 protein n=1 Tax=Kocuria rosea TaxID=1275 RepID=A0A4R5XZN6_KOCRO|nr:glycosyltransferase family A protein [Kocuria rosea]TDL37471.1 glycosyltransferase family 2 protein [Kocuria rosea]
MFDVIIPAYNAETSVAQAVRSALASGASKVIVVDDGSLDGTSQVAHWAGATVITQTNAGASVARLRGADNAEADLLVFLDADDELIPQGVRVSLEIFETHPVFAAVGGAVEAVMPNGRRRVLRRSYDGPISTSDLIVRGYSAWPPGAAIVRRDAYIAAMELSVSRLSTRYAEDYEMLLRLSLVGEIFAHQTPSISYRMYDGKSSRNHLNPLLDKERIRAHYATATGVSYAATSPAELRSSSYFRGARTKWARGEHVGAVLSAARGALTNPSMTARKLATSAHKALER